MADQSIKVNFTGDASDVIKAAKQAAFAARQAAKQAADAAKETKESVKNIGDVVGSIGDVIGGVGGEFANLITSIMSATGPLMALTAIIGGIASAWKFGKEAVDDYLKSVDKVQLGSIGFNQETREARKDTRKRAVGGVLQSQREYDLAQVRLNTLNDQYFKTSDAGQKKKIEQEIRFYEKQVEEAKIVNEVAKTDLARVTGFKNKVAWEVEYNNLKKNEAVLEDERLQKEIDFENLEAKIAEQRKIVINQESTSQQKKEAANKAELFAKQLLEEKTVLRKKELDNFTALSEMTNTMEATEKQRFQMQKDLSTYQKEYEKDTAKALMLENKAEKNSIQRILNEEKLNRARIEGLGYLEALVAENEKLPQTSAKYLENLKRINEINSESKKGFFVADAQQLKVNVSQNKKLPVNTGLSKYGGLSRGETNAIADQNQIDEGAQQLQGYASQLEGIFSNLFANISSGSKNAFGDMVKSFKRAIGQMVAEIAAKAVVFSILNIISGGTSGIAKMAGSLTSGGFKKFVFGGAFADGTEYAPGGLSLVGERGPELVQLPKGAKVMNDLKTKSIINSSVKGLSSLNMVPAVQIKPKAFSKSQVQKDVLLTRLAGKDIDIVLKRYQAELSNNT